MDNCKEFSLFIDPLSLQDFIDKKIKKRKQTFIEKPKILKTLHRDFDRLFKEIESMSLERKKQLFTKVIKEVCSSTKARKDKRGDKSNRREGI